MLEMNRITSDWIAQTLDTRPMAIEPVSGGGNNRVYRIDVDGGRTFLLKQYYHDVSDPRDRLGAEYEFSCFAWSAGLRCIPRPIAKHAGEHVALYEFIHGKKPGVLEIDRQAIDQAMLFISTLNQHRMSTPAQQLAPASEACFSITEHVDRIKHRITRLQTALSQAEFDAGPARAFVEDRLMPAWHRVQFAIERQFSVDERHTLLSSNQRCISPSDFGFHNTLQDHEGKFFFLDFEYAGWDDPAKLAGDFFSQVNVPVPLVHIQTVTETLASLHADPAVTRHRILCLLPLYRIKWCCIAMNEFIPQEHRRRMFAVGEDAELRRSRQLEKSVRLLDRLPDLEDMA